MKIKEAINYFEQKNDKLINDYNFDKSDMEIIQKDIINPNNKAIQALKFQENILQLWNRDGNVNDYPLEVFLEKLGELIDDVNVE